MNRFQRRYELLKGQGRCTRCTRTLPPDCPFNQCQACHDKAADTVRARRRAEGVEAMEEKRRRREEQIAAVIATAPTRTAVQQAEDLGVSVDRVYGLRSIARRRGFDVPVERGGNQGGTGGASGKWEALESDMARVCERCELRGDHECLPDHPDPTRRNGPGAVYPSHGW